MPDTISGADTRKKGTLHWFAMAFARAVLPHPGGPCSKTPRGGSTPNHAYTCNIMHQLLQVCQPQRITVNTGMCNRVSMTSSMCPIFALSLSMTLKLVRAVRSWVDLDDAHLRVLQRMFNQLSDVAQHALNAPKICVSHLPWHCKHDPHLTWLYQC